MRGLLEAGFHVFAQDRAFSEAAAWESFSAGRRGLITIAAVAPEDVVPAVFQRSAQLDASVPTGRLAEPEAIGELIAFLASAKTRHLTGAVIDFSGGWPFGPEPPG
ncbi:MAG: SDR family oxidoreductase [Oceanicaulis sp.]